MSKRGTIAMTVEEVSKEQIHKAIEALPEERLLELYISWRLW